jgi:hypothetical protein
MRGSEYLALRVAACTAVMALGGGFVFAVARWVLPWLMGRVSQAYPGPLAAFAGIVFGMGVIVLVSHGLRVIVGYTLLRIDRLADGGSRITDEDGGD